MILLRINLQFRVAHSLLKKVVAIKYYIPLTIIFISNNGRSFLMHKELFESRRTQSSSDRTKKIKLIFANLFKEGLQVIISNHFKSLRFGVDEKVVESKRIPFIRVGYNLN